MRDPVGVGVTLIALFTLPAMAQTVTKASPSPVQIQAGGAAVALALEGTNLGLVSAARVVVGGVGSPSVTGMVVTIRSRTTISLTSDLTAASTVTPGTYQLELTAGTQRIIANVPITVSRPVLQPLDQPTITTTEVKGVTAPAPSVTSASPTTVALRAGGTAQTVALNGTMLDKVTGAYMELNGTRKSGFQIQLISTTDPTRRQLRVAATAQAGPPWDVPLALVLEYPVGTSTVPLTSRVATPVKITASAPPPVDLIVSNCTISQNGDKVINRATIKNNGTEGVSFQTDQEIARATPSRADGGTFYSPFRAPAGGRYIAPGGTVDFGINFNSPSPGPYAVTWSVDPGDVVAESNPSNNSRACRLEVAAPTQPPPTQVVDVGFSAITSQPSDRIGSTQTNFVFTLTVKNFGNVGVEQGWKVQCFIDEKLFGDFSVLRYLAPQATYEQAVYTRGGFVPGNHPFECRIDPNQLQLRNESNIGNNYRSLVFTVTSGLDTRTP